MTDADDNRAITEPIELITDLVTTAEPCLPAELIRSIVLTVSGGRAKARRLAAALAARPEVLLDGRGPAPRAVGDLLRALRTAGANVISSPCCATCDKPLRTWTAYASEVSQRTR